MKIEILKDGEPVDLGFYRLELFACVDILRPNLKLWGALGPMERAFALGDLLQLKGDEQLLFSGPVQNLLEVSNGQLRVVAYEPVAEPLTLNFRKERWENILKEVCSDYAFDGEDFELPHYPWKCSQSKHLTQLKAALEGRCKKDYWMYLDENATLQLHPAGSSRGEVRIPEKFLLERGAEALCYKPFPLLLAQVSGEGISERLELSIRNGREELRVWWGDAQEKAKGTIKNILETGKDIVYGDGKIFNNSRRRIYVIISGSHNINVVLPGRTYTEKIDGVVDIVGKQVYKMNENTYLEFTSNNQFSFIKGNSWFDNSRESLQEFGDRIKSGEPYGLYSGVNREGVFQFVHESGTPKSSIDMKNWYNRVIQKETGL